MHNPRVQIATPGGIVEAHPGDWIIRGPDGTFYPCQDDLFVLAYNPTGDV